MAQVTSASPIVDIAKQPILAYNEKNWEAARESFGPDVVYDEVATHRLIAGRDEVLQVWRGWAAAFPDSRAIFERAIGTGSTVTMELRWRGTHAAPLELANRTIAPTRKTIDMRACQIVEVRDGKVQAVRHYFDVGTMIQQLGVKA